MKRKPVILRARADRDVMDAVEYYLQEASAETAHGFADALEKALIHVGRNPATGSPRFGHELDLPGLRSWPLRRFPYLIFYLEHEDHVDVWRVLHGQRDIPAWMQATAGL